MVIYFFSKDSDADEWRKEKQKGGEKGEEKKQEEHARKGGMRNSSGEELNWKSATKDGGS